MKHLFLIIFLNLSLYGFSQKKAEGVDQNNQKIQELNERLNNLVKESETLPLDSNSHKIDMLINEIGELKKEMQEIRQSVDELYQSNRENLTDSETQENSQEEYYIVIDSERHREMAEIKLKELEKHFDAKLVQNKRKSWYHIVISTPYPKTIIIEEVKKIRKEFIADVWCVRETGIHFL